MSALGVNVPLDGSVSADQIAALGASWIRIVAHPDHDLRAYFDALHARGIRVLLVLARESGGDYNLFERWYGDMEHVWIQPGNEPEGTGESSWSMTPHEFVSLGRTARAIFPLKTIVAGGLVSGQPSYLDGLDLSWADFIAPHPYGKTVADWPSPGWGTGVLGDLLDGYAAFGKPLFISEIGLNTREVSEDFQAEYLTRVFDYVNSRSDVAAVCWFCWSDTQV